MCKELKFRTWSDEVHAMTIPYTGIEQVTKDIVSGYDIMQYTCLKDKTGKEIYEGDIIRARQPKGFSGHVKTTVAVVEFKEGCFGYYEYYIDAEDCYFDSCWDVKDIEVIGNIYENPELLKDDKNASDS